jgi:hypothetical protein
MNMQSWNRLAAIPWGVRWGGTPGGGAEGSPVTYVGDGDNRDIDC